MSIIRSAVLLLSLLALSDQVTVQAQDAAFNEEKVMVLTSSNFDSTIKENEYVLAEFYAPWCGHCKQLAPEYANAALALAEQLPDVVLAKVDATVETELAERFEVEGFPTLKWFVNGTDHEYTGGRDEAAIVTWVTKKTGPSTVTITSSADLAQQEAQGDTVVFGYFSALDDADPLYSAFATVAADVVTLPFVQTTNAEAAKAAGITEPGTVAIITNFQDEDRAVVKYSGAADLDDLADFVDIESIPPTLEFNDANNDRIFGSGVQRHILLVGTQAQVARGSPAFNALREVSPKFKGKFVFVNVNGEHSEAEMAVEFFDLELGDEPILVGFEIEPKQKRYRHHGTIDAAGIEAFASGILAGTVDQIRVSAPIPENDMDGDVKIVVADTFDDIVKDSSKDVLLEIYAPWCGHCKALAPVYAQLATRFRDVDSVVIAKMDGTENEHPDIDLEGFPTLYLFPAVADAEPIDVEADRTLKDLTEFMRKNAKIPFKLSKSDAELAIEDEESFKAAAEAGVQEDEDEELETGDDYPGEVDDKDEL